MLEVDLDNAARVCSARLAQDYGCLALAFGQDKVAVFDLASDQGAFAYTTQTIGAFDVHMHAVLGQYVRRDAVSWHFDVAA